MKLSELCSHVYKACTTIKSQKKFVSQLFTASGEAPYIAESYKQQLFSGNKPFTDNLKVPLRAKDNQCSLEEFFFKNIADDRVLDVLVAFGVPEKQEPNKKALSAALALQMKALIDTDKEDANDIIISAYQAAKAEPLKVESELSAFKPLYPGDEIYVDTNVSYQTGIYETVAHTWSLQNVGKIKWTGRKLIYKRGIKDRPEADPAVIELPDVSPGESIKISTTFDCRGFDGIHRCVWEMQDADGENCFPKRDALFCVTLNAKFKRK